jgi:fructan beta-fructosidase
VPLRDSAGHVTLTIFLDQSSVEIFVNRGETVFTALVFPTEPYNEITLKSSGNIALQSGQIHELQSIWQP